ncbi:MAG: diacylglycerol/lipid kinase family protein [Methylocystaceae bacterium]
MDCTLIVNPGAGSYSHRLLGETIAHLAAEQIYTRVYTPLTAEQATGYAASASAAGEVVLAMGGDGTINSVINGLKPGSTLGIIPAGTVNVLAREIGVRTPRRAWEAIVQGRVRPLTVGRVKNADQERLFTLMVGIGIDGRVVKNVRSEEKHLLGKGAYALALVRSLQTRSDQRLMIGYEGGDLECDSIIVCNASLYGGDIRMARQANVFSPQLEALFIRSSSHLEYIETASRLLLDLDIARRLLLPQLSINGIKPVQVDGDFFGYSPITVDAIPEYITIFC